MLYLVSGTWFILPNFMNLEPKNKVGKSVVDLGQGPGSPVPGYRLGSRESVRLGRFH